MNLRAPLAQVRGLGSAKEGSQHWFAQRISAVALIFLTLWLAFSLASVMGADYATAKLWIARPWNTTLLVCFFVAGFYHAILGLQVVIEDYLPVKSQKMAALITMKLLLTVFGVGAVIAVLRAALGGV